MKITYDPPVRAFYITVVDRDIKPGERHVKSVTMIDSVILDFSDQGELLGVEILK